MYHFVLGFISKLVGTEVGIIEPTTSFSLCFGAAFMPHKMNVHAELFMRNGNVSSCRVGIHQGRVVGYADVATDRKG